MDNFAGNYWYMNTQFAYDNWSAQYDSNINKTRDLEAIALRETLANIAFKHCLEMGCGTGKNSEWLLKKASGLTAVDLSAAMLAKAKEKIPAGDVRFVQADMLQDWDFADREYDLVSFSLVLEHIEDLDPVFEKCAAVMASGGHLYIGELHPFKQYTGSKARYTSSEGEQVLTCYNHNISDFVLAAKKYGFELTGIHEYFDDGDRSSIPRVLSLLFRKQ